MLEGVETGRGTVGGIFGMEYLKMMHTVRPDFIHILIKCVVSQFKSCDIMENYAATQITRGGRLSSANNTVSGVRSATAGKKF